LTPRATDRQPTNAHITRGAPHRGQGDDEHRRDGTASGFRRSAPARRHL